MVYLHLRIGKMLSSQEPLKVRLFPFFLLTWLLFGKCITSQVRSWRKRMKTMDLLVCRGEIDRKSRVRHQFFDCGRSGPPTEIRNFFHFITWRNSETSCRWTGTTGIEKLMLDSTLAVNFTPHYPWIHRFLQLRTQDVIRLPKSTKFGEKMEGA